MKLILTSKHEHLSLAWLDPKRDWPAHIGMPAGLPPRQEETVKLSLTFEGPHGLKLEAEALLGHGWHEPAEWKTLVDRFQLGHEYEFADYKTLDGIEMHKFCDCRLRDYDPKSRLLTGGIERLRGR